MLRMQSFQLLGKNEKSNNKYWKKDRNKGKATRNPGVEPSRNLTSGPPGPPRSLSVLRMQSFQLLGKNEKSNNKYWKKDRNKGKPQRTNTGNERKRYIKGDGETNRTHNQRNRKERQNE